MGGVVEGAEYCSKNKLNSSEQCGWTRAKIHFYTGDVPKEWLVEKQCPHPIPVEHTIRGRELIVEGR
jgi:hypothetical protein